MKIDFNLMKGFLGKHSSEILIGAGIAGMLGAMVKAVKNTPEACERIEKRKEELEVDELGKWETIKTTAPCYVVPAIMTTVSIGCIFGGNVVNVRRNAALATAYVISETALKDYKDKVVEVIGDKKELDIRERSRRTSGRRTRFPTTSSSQGTERPSATRDSRVDISSPTSTRSTDR